MKAFRRSSTHYALTNLLGNVMAVISDAPSDGAQPTVESLTDYYPFGMAMPGRSYMRKSGEDYRYGFQGQDKEKELWGGEASFFKYRISDNRLGRFFSVDPLSSKLPWNSSYAFSENRVIDAIELEGLESFLVFNFGGDTKYRNSIYENLYGQSKTFIFPAVSLEENSRVVENANGETVSLSADDIAGQFQYAVEKEIIQTLEFKKKTHEN